MLSGFQLRQDIQKFWSMRNFRVKEIHFAQYLRLVVAWRSDNAKLRPLSFIPNDCQRNCHQKLVSYCLELLSHIGITFLYFRLITSKLLFISM